MTLWPALAVVSGDAGAWQKDVTKLIEMRNAIAHADEAKRQSLDQEGYALSAQTVRHWHQTLDALTVAMDDVVSEYLGVLLRTARPW